MVDPKDTHVSATDAFTLQLERDPALRATIVAVVVLDQAPQWERLVERVEHATRLAPTFRHRLVASPLRLATPRWVPDPDFDLTWHVRHVRVTEGGDMDEVLELARTAQMAAFDHDRPLWEMTVVEGLADERAALVLKVHHALTDGIGGVQIAAHVVDLDREPGDLPPAPAPPAPVSTWGPVALAESLGHDVRHVLDLTTSAVRAAPRSAWNIARDPLGAATRARGELASIARMVQPVLETRSPVMTERRLVRHFRHLDVPLAELKAAAATVDGTLNDAFVAGIAGGMRIYHEHHGACVSELRVTMPISIRDADDAMGGNHIGLVRFPLPIGVVDPQERMRRVHEICAAQRQEPALSRSEAIASALNLLPVSITGGMLHHVDLLASNVPGLPITAYVAGARLEAFYPFGATLGSAANITLMSHTGTCNIGITTDAGAVPDPDEFLASMRAGFDEVAAVG